MDLFDKDKFTGKYRDERKPGMQVYFPSTGTTVECSVRDLFVDFDGPYESVDIKPFETAAQAIRREYPGCIIFIKGLNVTPGQGRREWWG